MHLVGNNSSMQPTMVCGWIYISSWSVFINIVFCPCYLFLLWNVVLKCLALCLITITAACFPYLYACLTCSSVHASYLLTHCLPTIVCVMFMSMVFFFIFAICYIFLWLHFGLFVHIFTLSFLFLCHSMRLLQFCIVTFPSFSMQFQEVMHAETSCGLWF